MQSAGGRDDERRPADSGHPASDSGAPSARSLGGQDARGPRRYTFPRHLRITRSAEFKQVLAKGLRVFDGRLTVWALGNGLAHPRLGLVVGRRHGGAVQRNRLKRIIRTAFRLAQHELPRGVDLVCSPRPGAALQLADTQASLRRLAAQLARQLGHGG